MKKLSPTWLTEQWVDFEYKQYLVLAYLQQVDHEFEYLKLYPHLSELLEHFQQMKQFRDNKEMMQQGFARDLNGIDLEKLQLQYKAVVEDDELMQELEKTLNFSLPLFRERIETGKDLYDQVEEQIEWFPVGIIPLYKEEGYLLIKAGEKGETAVHQYQQTIFTSAEERFRSCKLEPVDSYPHNLFNTFEHIKKDLVKRFRALPNPATFVAWSRTQVPLQETLMPIATRRLLRALA